MERCMGCDIHMIAEQKSKWDDNSGEWEPMLSPIFKDRFYDPERKVNKYNAPYTFQPYDNRNYALFAVLANVRNGHDIKPICEPRDYPEDIHHVSKWLLDGWDFAEHSLSWLTLNEVLAYDWSQPSPYLGEKTLGNSCKEFLEACETLRQYAEGDNCDIRLIFGFDS